MVSVFVVVLTAAAVAVLPFDLGLPTATLAVSILLLRHWRSSLKEADDLRADNSAFQSSRAPLAFEASRPPS